MTSSRRTDRDAIIGKIRALMAKKEENGATEAEALAAAAKVSQLMAQYGLGMDEVELGAAECATSTIADAPTEYDWIVPAVAKFAEVYVWRSQTANGVGKINFFGLREDVEVAGYIYAICRRALDVQSKRFTAEMGLLRKEKRDKRIRSFRDGMANGIADALIKMAEDRRKSNQTASGRDLVVLKKAKVAEELAKLRLVTETQRLVRRDASPADFARGHEEGKSVRFSPGIRGAGPSADPSSGTRLIGSS